MPGDAPSWPPPAWFPATAPTVPQAINAAVNPYRTRLTPAEEREFTQWVKTARVPYADSPKADYDMRGFWLGLRNNDERAKTAVKNGQVHFPDAWKTPYHQSFSDESIYAVPGAPTWHGDLLLAPDGRLVSDERPPVPPTPTVGTLAPGQVRTQQPFADAYAARMEYVPPPLDPAVVSRSRLELALNPAGPPPGPAGYPQWHDNPTGGSPNADEGGE